eukprot:4617910-Amphidinium_carterae.1
MMLILDALDDTSVLSPLSSDASALAVAAGGVALPCLIPHMFKPWWGVDSPEGSHGTQHILIENAVQSLPKQSIQVSFCDKPLETIPKDKPCKHQTTVRAVLQLLELGCGYSVHENQAFLHKKSETQRSYCENKNHPFVTVYSDNTSADNIMMMIRNLQNGSLCCCSMCMKQAPCYAQSTQTFLFNKLLLHLLQRKSACLRQVGPPQIDQWLCALPKPRSRVAMTLWTI